MGRNYLSEYLIYLPLSILVLLTRVLPISLVHKLGMGIGWLVFRFGHKRRKIANNNLKAAFGKELSCIQREKIIKETFKNFGLNFMELFLMPRMNKTYFDKYTKIHNPQRIKEALDKGKGMIFLSAHYGNWELAASIAANNGYKMHALARVQKPYFLNDLLNHYREIRGTSVVQKGMQLREMVKILKKNGIVGMIGDQSGRIGREIDFFGRPIFMAEGAFKIAAATGSIILPAFNVRSGAHHDLIIEKPIEKQKNEDTEQFINRAMLQYRDLLKGYITKNPHLWLWGHRRWKYTSARTVVILTDQKTGHLRQAQAVAKSISDQISPTRIIELKVNFKNKFTERLLDVFMLGVGKLVQNPMPFLRFALRPESYEKLRDEYADIIICTGSSTRAVGLLLANENLAKLISIMKPSPFSTNWFDLSIIGYHDCPKQKKNVFITDGALNMISPEYLSENGALLKQHVDIGEGLKIGVLIGGDSKYHKITLETIEKVVEQLKKFAEGYNAQVLLSASRRTSNEIVEFLHRSFDNYQRCIFKVYPNEKNFEFAIGGILDVCSAVIVSGESISMVSEAASSGAYTIVFDVEKKIKRTTKHNLFLNHLEKIGIIILTGRENIYGELEKFNKDAKKLKKLNDQQKLYSIVKEKILK